MIKQLRNTIAAFAVGSSAVRSKCAKPGFFTGGLCFPKSAGGWTGNSPGYYARRTGIPTTRLPVPSGAGRCQRHLRFRSGAARTTVSTDSPASPPRHRHQYGCDLALHRSGRAVPIAPWSGTRRFARHIRYSTDDGGAAWTTPAGIETVWILATQIGGPISSYDISSLIGTATALRVR